MPLNVRQARSFLGQLLQHSDPTKDTRDFRVQTMSNVMMSIADMGDWLFAEDETDWKVWTERDGETLNNAVTVTNGAYNISFASTLGASFTDAMGGQPFTAPNGTEYTINRFTSTTVAYLDRAYEGSTVTSTDWRIQPYRFYLPVNCARALAFLNRDITQQVPAWIPILDRRTEERTLSPWTTYQSNVVYVVDNSAEFDRPPDIGATLSDTAGAGSLSGDSDYEVCYTTTQFGRESPPSQPIAIKTSSAALHEITITGMENTTDGGLATGIFKNVYIRRLTSSQDLPSGDFYSRWLQATSGLGEATITYKISAFPGPRAQQLMYQNGRKFMRTVWRPQRDMTLRLRYLIRPDWLVGDSDTPQRWPDAYLYLLPYGAAIEIGTSQGASGQKLAQWQKKYNDLLKEMKDEHLLVPNAPSQRKMRTDGGAGGFGDNGLWTRGPAFGNFWGG